MKNLITMLPSMNLGPLKCATIILNSSIKH